MKNYFIFFASLCTMALVSCASDNDVVDPTPAGQTFQASINLTAGSAETRMTHDDAGTTDATYAWQKSTDHLGLFSDALTTQNVDLTSQNNGTEAGFTSTGKVDFSQTGTQTFYAYYPYQTLTTLGTIAGTDFVASGFKLPSNQGDGTKWAEYSLAYSNAMSAKVVEGGTVAPRGDMTHLFAYLKFAFCCSDATKYVKTGDSYWQIGSVTISDPSATTVASTTATSLAGDYTFKPTDHTYSFLSDGNQSSSITLESGAFTNVGSLTGSFSTSIGTKASDLTNGTVGSMMVVPTNAEGKFVLNGKAVTVMLNKVKSDGTVLNRRMRTRVLDKNFSDVSAGDVCTVGLRLEDDYSGPLWEDESGLIKDIVYVNGNAPEDGYTNLVPNAEYANCYIIPSSTDANYNANGKYYIPAVKPDGKSVASELIEFTIDNTKHGNAVLAYPDNTPSSTSPKQWSWHIWAPVTKPGTEDIVTYNDANTKKVYTLMNMDLGAMNHYDADNEAATSEKHTLYQWGRKDPFSNLKTVYMYGVERSVGDDTNGGENSSVTWPRVEASTTTGSIEYAYAHPEIFLTQPSADDKTDYTDVSTHYKWDWLFGVDHSVAATNDADNRWGNPYTGTSYSGQYGGNHNSTYTKTNYDPCPYGYKVPPMDTWNRLLTTGNRQRRHLWRYS
jgi:hypothetical protein